MTRLGIGRPASNSDMSAGGFTSLIDILLATIGIFLIVFTVQSVSHAQRLQPAPYDGIISCDAEADVALDLKLPDGTLTHSDLAKGTLIAALRDLLKNGGRFLIALDPLCLIDESADSPSSQLARLEGDLSDLADPDTTHQFEYVPLGPSPDDLKGLRHRWLGTSND